MSLSSMNTAIPTLIFTTSTIMIRIYRKRVLPIHTGMLTGKLCMFMLILQTCTTVMTIRY